MMIEKLLRGVDPPTMFVVGPEVALNLASRLRSANRTEIVPDLIEGLNRLLVGPSVLFTHAKGRP